MMLKKIIFSCILFAVCFAQSEQEHQSLLLQAQEHFIHGHYQDAYNLYQSLPEKGFVVFYNMGLCCLRQNKKAEALICFKRAEKQATSYKQFTMIDRLIELNEGKEPVDKKWYEQFAIFARKCILAIPILLFQLIVLLGFIFLIIIWYMQWYRKRIVVSCLFLIVWLGIYCLSLYKINFIQQLYAVVIRESVPVFAGPDNSFYKKSDLSGSQLVAIIDQKNEYYKIKSGNFVGWVDCHTIELV